MPERPLTIATYAVGASLCAISLLYVFGPGFTFEEDSSSSKRRIVGLHNPHNLCFCNSVLQALANSPGLRKYLIREIHRRSLDGADVYKVEEGDVSERGREAAVKRWKLAKLQEGVVTHALKTMLDRLNERPLQKKTITAGEFLSALETVFQTRVSSGQQDAQEFLQIVLERLCDEYHAGQKARRNFSTRNQLSLDDDEEHESADSPRLSDIFAHQNVQDPALRTESIEEDDQFPFEGQTESEIECQHCQFKPKPAVSKFVTLTLNVPYLSSTTLNECFDGVFKQEVIEGYRCDKCRLTHAKALKQRQLELARDARYAAQLQGDLNLIESALEEDPERELKEANLPVDAPRRTIKKAMRISRFPKVLAIHLSRSLYSTSSLSTKNTAKVSFPEGLQVGGLLDTHNYRLASVITHKGGHNSGHYETFRRQYNPLPISTPSSFGTHGVYSRQASPSPSSAQFRPRSANLHARQSKELADSPGRLASEADVAVTSPTPLSSKHLSVPHASDSAPSTPRSSLSIFAHDRTSQSRPSSAATRDSVFLSPTLFSEKSVSAATLAPPGKDAARMQKRHRKLISRWWRVSDDKVKESKTSDVLGMQREVYLLFYEAEQ